jgi:hypothetical protein
MEALDAKDLEEHLRDAGITIGSFSVDTEDQGPVGSGNGNAETLDPNATI